MLRSWFHAELMRSGLRGWGLGACILAGLVLIWPSDSAAHRTNSSRTLVLVYGDSLRLELAIDETDLLVAFDVDGNGDGILWRQEMMKAAPAASDFLSSHLHLWADAEELSLEHGRTYVAPDGQGNLFLHVGFTASLEGEPLALTMEADLFEVFSEGHKNLAMVRADGGPPQPAVFSAAAPRHQFVLRVEPEPGAGLRDALSSPADHPLGILAAVGVAALILGVAVWVRRSA